MFVAGPFRGVDKNETPVAFLDACSTCEQTAAQLMPYWPYTDFRRVAEVDTEAFLSLAYYWEWSARDKAFKPCFGTVFEDKTARQLGLKPRFNRSAYYKRVPWSRDYDAFRRKHWSEPGAALHAHQYTHFNLADLDAMLNNPAHLPLGTSTWSYWEPTA